MIKVVGQDDSVTKRETQGYNVGEKMSGHNKTKWLNMGPVIVHFGFVANKLWGDPCTD